MFGGQTLLVSTDTVVFSSIAFIGTVTCFFVVAVVYQCVENGYCADCSLCCPPDGEEQQRRQNDSDIEAGFIYDEP